MSDRVKQVLIKNKREGILFIEAQFRYSKQAQYKRVTIGPYEGLDRAFVDTECQRFLAHCEAGGTPATFTKRLSEDDEVPASIEPVKAVAKKGGSKKRPREEDRQQPSLPSSITGGGSVIAEKSPSSRPPAKGSKLQNESSTPQRKQQNADSGDDDERVWVRCNICDKWRALPSTVDADELPDMWECSMNAYDSERNHCEAAEESYSDGVEEPIQSFLKVWSKKLRVADRAESRFLARNVMLRSQPKKKNRDVEWIRCCNPSCGKWRAVTLSIETEQMLLRLMRGNSKSWGASRQAWYCSMNNWDETQASCSAPQEPLFDCKWNI